jgi:hypothetical protein
MRSLSGRGSVVGEHHRPVLGDQLNEFASCLEPRSLELRVAPLVGARSAMRDDVGELERAPTRVFSEPEAPKKPWRASSSMVLAHRSRAVKASPTGDRGRP